MSCSVINKKLKLNMFKLFIWLLHMSFINRNKLNDSQSKIKNSIQATFFLLFVCFALFVPFCFVVVMTCRCNHGMMDQSYQNP